MSLFQWDDSYSVGYAEIDNQHKRWFQLAHELHSAVVTGKGKEVLRQTLASLVTYTKGHLAMEERLMLTHGYPDYQEHKDQHESVLRKLLALQQDFETGRATVAMDFLKFLKAWLAQHINVLDHRVGAYLRQKAR
jgi:hemerythrin